MVDKLFKEEGHWQRGGHRVIVEFCEGEGCLAEFAVFLLGVGQPLHQALLVHKTYAPAAFAWIE